ncbi:MAG: glutathione S-transferase N-terminal domain-containing protein [Pseudomonadales bacterium]|nr:glutathione S-transferase N-terminal domain-containing protein [Pseudomonadales bacterium]
MKLFCTPNSPFSRVARVLVDELGLAAAVEITTVTVRDPDSELLTFIASGKVPALYVDDSQTLCDTRMIAQYLAHTANRDNVTASLHNIEDYAFEGFCLSFLESICVWVREARRAPAEVSEQILQLERARAVRCLLYLEKNLEKLQQPFGLASIAVACAMDIASRRLDFSTDNKQQKLAQWFKKSSNRSSMLATQPLSI